MDGNNQRITILSTGLRRGGAETQVVRLAGSLIERGWSCRILTLVDGNDYADELVDSGVPVHSFAMRSVLQTPLVLGRLRQELGHDRPRILLTFMYHANVMGRFAAWGLPIPAIIGSIRNENFGGRWRDRITRWTDPLCHRTTTNSPTVAERLVERGVVLPAKMAVVPNGVVLPPDADDQEARAVLRSEMGVGDGDFVWLSAGRLTEAKDYPGLLAAFSQLVEVDPQALLWIAGSGELEPEIRSRIEAEGWTERVRLLGMRKDLVRWMRAADAFVLSSRWEGLPNVLLESMAAGLPVVATRVGGVPEILGEESPWQCPAGRPDALAERMRRMMELSAESRRRLGQDARRRVEAGYSQDAVVRQWLELFEGVVEERRP